MVEALPLTLKVVNEDGEFWNQYRFFLYYADPQEVDNPEDVLLVPPQWFNVTAGDEGTICFWELADIDIQTGCTYWWSVQGWDGANHFSPYTEFSEIRIAETPLTVSTDYSILLHTTEFRTIDLDFSLADLSGMRLTIDSGVLSGDTNITIGRVTSGCPDLPRTWTSWETPFFI